MKKIIIVLLFSLIAILTIVGTIKGNIQIKRERPSTRQPGAIKTIVVDDWKNKGTNQYIATDRQKIWLSALMWHESRGIKTALNPKDRNGQRSVGCYQFQDISFKHYVSKYQLLDVKNLEESDWLNWIWDCPLQTEIVIRMLGDSDVKWANEFPDVVKNKIGLPPK